MKKSKKSTQFSARRHDTTREKSRRMNLWCVRYMLDVKIKNIFRQGPMRVSSVGDRDSTDRHSLFRSHSKKSHHKYEWPPYSSWTQRESCKCKDQTRATLADLHVSRWPLQKSCAVRRVNFQKISTSSSQLKCSNEMKWNVELINREARKAKVSILWSFMSDREEFMSFPGAHRSSLSLTSNRRMWQTTDVLQLGWSSSHDQLISDRESRHFWLSQESLADHTSRWWVWI